MTPAPRGTHARSFTIFALVIALFVLLGASINITDALNRTDIGRGIHAFGGALWLTFPLFLIFGAGATVLGIWVVYSRRKLFGFVVALGLLPLFGGLVAAIWVTLRAFR